MSRLRAILAMSFQAKVLVPVVSVMMLLTATLIWMGNRRTLQQFRTDTVEQLETAEAVFRNWQRSRADDLLSRYQIIANEPNFQGIARDADPTAFRSFLDKLVDRRFINVDVVVAATDEGQLFPAITHDPRVDAMAFVGSCSNALAQAIKGQPRVDIVRNGDGLFDVVAVPIRSGQNVESDKIIGAVCFGVRNSIAREFYRLTRSELVLIADGRIVSAAGVRKDWQPQLIARFARLSGLRVSKERNPIDEITLGDEKFFCVAGWLNGATPEHGLGYLILSSFQEPLETLRSTERTLLLLGALAILFGTAVVWYIVRRATQPLRELRNSAEAVGRGDFSRRVKARSEDECGELARVFNQMTENLKNSREQLEMTVETLKTTQARLVHSEKLSGLGEFVAGVAHELNNPLTSVMGFSDLMRRANTDAKQKRHLDMIYKSALRCQKIVQALLDFARHRAPERKPVCLNRLVEAALEMLQYQLRTSNIEVRTRLDSKLPPALVDPHQIQQVLVNIINNARQAIEAQHTEGWIRVATEAHDGQVRVIIQDSGPGIPEENLKKVFSPFFTTKEAGTGTGLGLSLCSSIIQDHGGTITPFSNPAEGATFVIELPVASESRDPSAEKTVSRPETTGTKAGVGRKVLVIDDEEPILLMVRDALTGQGYKVDLASDGEAGLRRLRRQHYDLALCDWKMPGLNGQEVYERLRAADPGLAERIIFITGDVANETARKFLEEHNKICLPKPFTLDEFQEAITKVMANSKPKTVSVRRKRESVAQS